MTGRILLTALLIVLAARIASGQIPRAISYQGVLTDATGKLVPDGNYNFAFRIYDVATGGSVLWSEPQTLPVSKGIFNAILGSAVPLGLPFDKPYWLGMTVGASAELAPRSSLTASAYSMNTISITDGAVGTRNLADSAVVGAKIGTGQIVRSLNMLKDDVTLAAGSNVMITRSGSTLTIAASGGGGGLALPYSDSVSSASAAFAVKNNGTGDGVLGVSMSRYGVHGVSYNSEGVYGWSGTGYGVYGSSSNTGVFGQSTTGRGVYGNSNSSDGVSGTSSTGYGVHGSSVNVGVYGESTTGDAVVGESGSRFGVHGNSQSGDGVYGWSSTGYGVHGISPTSDAVFGESGSRYGVHGNSISGKGVYGYSKDSYGVMGSSTNSIAVYAAGPFTATGAKSATVKLNDGTQVRLFTEEATEVIFADYGQAKLTNGTVHVELDPVFLQTVSVDAQHPLKVFVQLEGDCRGVFVTNKTATGFDVVELQGGVSNAQFSYRVVCKRKYFEDERLAREEQDIQYNSRMMRSAWPEVVAEQQMRSEKMKADLQKMPAGPVLK